VHPSHSGSQQSVTITPPLTRIWTLRFDELVSYPIMAESRVFVALNTTVALTESVVQALDAASGAVLWSSTIHASVTFTPVMLAYDRGLLFVATESCDVLALEPATGKVRWQTTLATTAPSDALPIAAGGAVMLVGAAGPDERALYVIDEHDGSLVYSVVLPVGGDPTLGGGRIYVTGTRDETAAVDAATGNIEWSTSATSNLVSGRAGSVIHDGVLWLRPTEDGIRAVDAASGSTLGKLEDPSPAYMPSAAESQLVLPSVVPTNALRVFGATSGAFRWQVALPARPVLPALTTPDTVYVLAGTDDKFLYGVDLVRRQFSWQSSEPAAPAEMLDPGEHPLPQGMAASGGRIVVAYGHWLSAFAASN